MWPFCMRRHLMTQLLIVSSYLMKVSHLHWFQFSPRPFDLSTELASWGLVVSHLPRHQSSSTFHQTPWKIVYETKRKNPRTSGGHVFWNLGIFSKKKKEKDRTTSTSSLRVISLLLSTSGDDVSGGVFFIRDLSTLKTHGSICRWSHRADEESRRQTTWPSHLSL